jgi:thiosulfate reductase cytochrome b subunit
MYFHQKWLRVPVVPLHEYLGLAMLLSGVVYIASGIVSGNLGKLLLGAPDVSGLLPMTAYYLRLRKEPPQCGEYNPLQKLAYTAVLLTIAPLIVATGFAMWKHSPLQPPLAEIFGRRSARIWHVGFAVELVLFFAGHLMMVATTGLRNNVRSMVTGWYRASSPAPRSAATRETVSTTAQSRPASQARPARRMPAHR